LSQQRISTSSAPSAVSPGLHGREVRAVKMQRVEIEGEEVILVASAAENGVLAISQRDASRHLHSNTLPQSIPPEFAQISHLFSSSTLSIRYKIDTLRMRDSRAIDSVRDRGGIKWRRIGE
ncbi:hypothetical protein JCM5350_004045, partial [Sporobolomyces pararoseus]